MGVLRIPKHHIFFAFPLLVSLHIYKVICYQYKVGDLDAWGIPTAANPHVYTYWSKYHNFKLGDSLLLHIFTNIDDPIFVFVLSVFLYPPSQDSVIQVTEQSFKACNTKDPLLYMGDGNSLFNITSPGKFYFTSGDYQHCLKGQKLEISVLSGDGSALSPSNSPSSTMPNSAAPSYPTVFGSIPASNITSPSSSAFLRSSYSLIFASFIASTILALII
ncbi:hypothetical protein Syun_019849 [Stephania yunnanensis]|uniref:Phytocyanin domain-containing protein n=1 Tax=Stephania yunnanensis TaxID=152371 RepID=A0AAP0IUS3_9MAGN